MLPYFTQKFGNPGSVHGYGDEARSAVDAARGEVATLIGAEASEIVFTSGATESNNLAIRGVATRKRRRGDHLISIRTEHPAVLDPLESLARHGYSVTLLDVAQHGTADAGRVDPQRVAEAITDQTCLVSVMLANNEVGAIAPVAAIARVCKQRGVLLHCDATQAVGKVPLDVRQQDVDLMSFTAHKLHGPKGAGALYVRRRDPVVRLEPQIAGGGQEQNRRSGTLNVPGIVGLATALRLAAEDMADEQSRLANLRNQLAERIVEAVSDAVVVGPALEAADDAGHALRLPNNLNVMFPGLDGEALMLAMPELAVSSGAACSSARDEPSHVLLALGLTADQARSCLRFGLGRFNTAEEIDAAANMVRAAVAKLGGTTG